MKLHDLKISPKNFLAILSENKTAELRINDRDYRVGDILKLRQYFNGEYIGGHTFREVIHIFSDEKYLQEGYVMLSLKPIDKPELFQFTETDHPVLANGASVIMFDQINEVESK